MSACGVRDTVVRWGSLVRFSHTIFAAPFALSMAAVCARSVPVSPLQLLWVVVALVTARTAAMAFNRLVDRAIDAKNPRTAGRELPAGILSVSSVRLLLLLSMLGFLLSSYLVGAHCLPLAPLVLAVLCGYSLTKRFTRCSHLVLGVALALAPGGVWFALTAQWSPVPLPLMAAVMVWVAGFDILYSCQDADFDREQGLFSLPSRIGVARAMGWARAFHVAAVVLLILFGAEVQLGMLYFVGVALFAALLFSQHLLVAPDDLSRIDAAFFTRNGCASLVFFLFVVLDCIAAR